MPTTPSASEQLSLELINRFRIDPAGEYARLTAAGTFALVQSAVGYFGVSLPALQQQLGALAAVAPLAWSGALADAARGHNAAMIAADTQSHQLPGEASLGERATAAGYRWSALGENVYAFANGELHGHAGFVIDWGYDAEDRDAAGQLLADWRIRGDGMQDPAGHRLSMMSAAFAEVGIATTRETDPATSVGGYVTTQDFGARPDYRAQALGVVIDDRDGDRFYDIGEGLGGVTVTLTRGGATLTTTTWDSGGWQIAAPAGTYAVRFSGGALAGAITATVTIAGRNVKLDAYAADARRADGPAPSDFDGDGRSDILWSRGDGAVSVWSSTAAGLVKNSSFAAAPAGWSVAEAFDFTGDGRADILWRNADGGVAAWAASGTGFAQGGFYARAGIEWSIAGVGDMDGDGRGDILWRRADGAVAAWTATGSGFEGSYYRAPVGTGWTVAGLGDLNGDGRDDLVWRSDSGALSVWTAAGSGFQENTYFDQVDRAWNVAGIGDFDGDGMDDLLWRDEGGAVSTWRSTGSGFAKNAFFDGSAGNDWRVATLADWDGDGRADLLWARNTGAISVWRSNGDGFDRNALYDAGASTDWRVEGHDFPLV